MSSGTEQKDRENIIELVRLKHGVDLDNYPHKFITKKDNVEEAIRNLFYDEIPEEKFIYFVGHCGRDGTLAFYEDTKPEDPTYCLHFFMPNGVVNAQKQVIHFRLYSCYQHEAVQKLEEIFRNDQWVHLFPNTTFKYGRKLTGSVRDEINQRAANYYRIRVSQLTLTQKTFGDPEFGHWHLNYDLEMALAEDRKRRETCRTHQRQLPSPTEHPERSETSKKPKRRSRRRGWHCQIS